MKRLIQLVLVLSVRLCFGQEGFPVNGVADERPGLYAFTNATVFVDYQTKIENATLLIRNGKVEAVGASLQIPKGAIVTDLSGKYIYPGLVEPYSNYGIPEPRSQGGGGSGPQYETSLKGPFGWNESIKSTFNAFEEFAPNPSDADNMRKLGFGSALAFKPDGIVRGTSIFTNLSNLSVQESVISEKAAAHFSFDKGTSRQAYPNSIMGMVALLRQTYLDAQWYSSLGKEEQTNVTLRAFNDLKSLPKVFEANGGKLQLLLADKVGDEFGVQYIIKGNGDEYQRINEIKATNASLIVPIDFPAAFDVSDPIAALDVSLTDMKHWEMAPANPKMLSDAGIEFAFTSNGNKDFLKSLRKSVEYGLSETAALKAITYTPAKYFNLQTKVGSLKKGMIANFFVASDNIFDPEATIQQTWVQGQKFEYAELNPKDISGNYDLSVGDDSYSMVISGEPGKHSAKIDINDSTEIKINLTLKENRVSMTFAPEGEDADVRLSGWMTENGFQGNGQDLNGEWIQWQAVKSSDLEKEESEDEEEESSSAPEIGDMMYPFVAYGWKEKPTQETILFKNATVWTLEGDGKLEGADVLIKNGKIAEVGTGLSGTGARVVDASGLHLTPGIIDEHSHVALSGVNESSSAVTAEVRMYDAVDSEDIDIYRQLAGGVTTSQLLHGSANPVGGQSALVKFRWGSSPEEMKIKGADGFIKFALGENVKQSNWGEDVDTRFPQTRMGVEQVYMNGFSLAKEYGQAWTRYNALSNKEKASTVAPRRDLRLETLLEIINKERFITCHSYVQSEISMLMNVADQFDFNVNTFTHILEGYKVADIMADHGVGGSTFSDWWFYKFEVIHAIPYNASLMTMAGVTTAINSDDAEMARRLNQEAAKSVKYGGMEEIEALKMVTLNPAKLLHLDDRMGSIKVGKDADLVLWTDHPLSIYAKPQMTLVDGIVYFSLEKDEAMRKAISDERTRLIKKLRDAKAGGAKTQPPIRRERHQFHCEDIVINGSILNVNDHE